MPILVLPPRYTPDSIALWHQAMAEGWETTRLQGWRVPEGLAEADPVFYGEPLLAQVVAPALKLALLEPSLGWVTDLPATYRQRDIRHATLDEARVWRQRAFIKPSDDKCFAAQVYADGTYLPSSEVLPGDTPVMIAEPITWEVEYRCFVLDRQVVAMSPYLRHGALAQAEDGSWPATPEELAEAQAYAARVLADPAVALPPAVVVDVGVIAGRGWAVIEANSAWGSGIYGCDPSRVLVVLRRASVPQAHLAATDAQWVIAR